MATVYFTICARNYLHYAMTLRASLLATRADAVFMVFLSDKALNEHDAERLTQSGMAGNLVIGLEALDLPDAEDMAMRYNIMELATAIKPYCFRYLLDERGYENAVYLDPDVYVLAPLSHVDDAFDNGFDATLIPHFLSPMPDDGHRPTADDVLASGVFNLGFAAIANTDGARVFLDWWAAACATRCFDDLSNGLFVDQKFADAAPALVDKLHILRHPGYNTAYWNLHERPVAQMKDGQWTSGGETLHFFHFSGVRPGDPGIFSKHQDRFQVSELGPVRSLLVEYLAELDRNGADHWCRVPYGYGVYDTGEVIPGPARRLYAEARSRGESVQPFRLDKARANAVSRELPFTPGAPITNLMLQLWKMRRDLQVLFPLTNPLGRRRFHAWFVHVGAREYRLDDAFVQPAKYGLAGLLLLIQRIVMSLAPAHLRARMVSRFKE